MFNNNSITEFLKIRNFLFSIGLTLLLTKPQISHVCNIIAAMTQKGYSGKIVDIVDLLLDSKHKSTIGKFLCSKAWDENLVLKKLQKFTINTIWMISKINKLPIYVVIDDTIAEKTKPSSKALSPTAKGKYHHSHLKGKRVYGHQIVVVLLKCGKVQLPLAILLYDKEVQSKIKMALDIIKMLPKPHMKGFVLADTWYSSKEIIKASKKAGYDYIGGLRVNRVIYPKGYRTSWSIKGFAMLLQKEDFHLVTVGKRSYYVYRYEGKLNGISGKTIVLLSWPEEAFGVEKALKSFVCTDINLSDEEILNHYVSRWPIEVFIRQTKMLLGLNKYQVRKEIAFKRLWILIMLSYCYICTQSVSQKFNFSSGLKSARREVLKEKMLWIYNQGQTGIPFEQVMAKVS